MVCVSEDWWTLCHIFMCAVHSRVFIMSSHAWLAFNGLSTHYEHERLWNLSLAHCDTTNYVTELILRLSPDIIPIGWLGSKHQVTNQIYLATHNILSDNHLNTCDDSVIPYHSINILLAQNITIILWVNYTFLSLFSSTLLRFTVLSILMLTVLSPIYFTRGLRNKHP